LAALPAFAANSVKATVNGMVCAFCAQGIEKIISKMDASTAVFVDLKVKVVLVEAKESKTLDQKAIETAIVSAVALAISGWIQWRNRTAPCPVDPRLRDACLRTRKASRRVYFAGLGFYVVRGWFAFVQPWLVA
jgi:copper chaperone CopZ